MRWKHIVAVTVLVMCRSSVSHTPEELLLANQLLQQQFYVEEMTRSAGQSGIINMRQRGEGTRPYHSTGHGDDFTMASTHDHTDFFNTCGMGEITAILNGVHFKTRHNDFLLVRKGDVGTDFDATVNIPYPPVPPSVLAEPTLPGQIAEMKKYFENYKEQQEIHPGRDYKPYFKEHLCYMQGAWTKSKTSDLQEAFFSERHYYAADSWRDLFQKQRYESLSGTKENLENFAYMPRVVWEVTKKGKIVFAQFNYKILCHQLDDHLPLNRLRGVDELKTQMSLQISYEDALTKRNARFQVNPIDSDIWIDQATKWNRLDKMMEEIPGPDGYGAHLVDKAFGNVVKHFNMPANNNTQLNTAYWHRWFQNKEPGAMGVKIRKRGMHDNNMWAAMTTQKNVLPSKLEMCKAKKKGKGPSCKTLVQRWVYAIPMEIIYTTPLHEWNPYDIEYKGLDYKPAGQTIYDGPLGTKTRDGSDDVDLAFDGTSSAKYYRTPVEFYEEPGEVDVDPADTPKPFTHVLDVNGVKRRVRASGIRTFMPSIAGVGRIRQRYPIPPIHGEGSSVWEELSALKKIVIDLRNCLEDICPTTGVPPLQLELGPSLPQFGSHTHLLTLNPSDLILLAAGNKVSGVVTEEAYGHTHTLVVSRHGTSSSLGFTYEYDSCSGANLCGDGHPKVLLDV